MNNKKKTFYANGEDDAAYNMWEFFEREFASPNDFFIDEVTVIYHRKGDKNNKNLS